MSGRKCPDTVYITRKMLLGCVSVSSHQYEVGPIQFEKSSSIIIVVKVFTIFTVVIGITRYMRAGGESAPSPSHLPTDMCAASALIITELAIRGRRLNRNLAPNFCPGRGLNPEPYDWQSSTLTTRLPRTPKMHINTPKINGISQNP